MTCEWTKKNIFTKQQQHKKKQSIKHKCTPLALFLNPHFFLSSAKSDVLRYLTSLEIHSARIKLSFFFTFYSSSSVRKEREREEKSFIYKGGGTAERRERRCNTLFIYYRSSVFLYIYSVCNLFFIASSFKRI